MRRSIVEALMDDAAARHDRLRAAAAVAAIAALSAGPLHPQPTEPEDDRCG